MLLASFAFIIAGVVEFKVEAGDMTLKAGETKLVMLNDLPSSLPTSFTIESMNMSTSFSIQPGEVRLDKILNSPNNFCFSAVTLTYLDFYTCRARYLATVTCSLLATTLSMLVMN